MPDKFWAWLDSKESELDLNDNKVALLAGISNSVISKARSGTQAIGHEALAKIAPVLKTPVSTAYRLAGYIEPEGAPSAEQAEWGDLFERLSDEDQEELLAIARVKARRGKNEKAKAR